MRLCKYGCGQKVKYPLKSSGKELVICSNSYNQCPTNKKKNSNGVRKAHREGRMPKDSFGDGRYWAKGLTKETDERIKRTANNLRESFKSGKIKPSFLGRKHSEGSKAKMRKKALSRYDNENGSCGYCKYYVFKKHNGEEIKVQGTWELRFARILSKIDKDFVRPKSTIKSLSWIDREGNNRKYIPDFYSPKLNKFFEVKGYWPGIEKDKMKRILEQNKDVSIEVIRKADLEAYEKMYS